MSRPEKEFEVSEVPLTNDNGIEVDGVEVTCPSCGAKAESFGTSSRSIRRCLVLMRDMCMCADAKGSFFVCDGSDN